MKTKSTFCTLVQAFFTGRLMGERNASPHTIANYRDTFRLLISFAERKLKKAPTCLLIEDLDAPFILGFLGSLEKERGNSPQTRNCRLAGIHSFFEFVARQEPALGGVAQRVLAIQGKRCAKAPVDYLTGEEMNALLDVPSRATWSGQRDRALLLSEAINFSFDAKIAFANEASHAVALNARRGRSVIFASSAEISERLILNRAGFVSEPREKWENYIKKSPNGIVEMLACSKGEAAGEDPLAGGYYTSLLLQSADLWGQRHTIETIHTTKDAHDYASSKLAAQQKPEYSPTWLKYSFAVKT